MRSRSLTPFRGLTPARLAFPALRDEMNQLFENFFEGVDAPGANAFQPSIDVREDAESVVITADLPGVEPDAIDVSVSDGVLTIAGERKSEEERTEGQTHIVERRFGTFRRSFTLPSHVDVEKIDASHEHGVLTIRLPKDNEARSKRIAVRAGK